MAATGVATNMALSGDGFFTVQTKGSDAGGSPVFSATTSIRRGDFAVDRDGYLVNGAGAYLTGQSLDPATGLSTGNGPIQISGTSLPAKATTSISYAANLPSTPATASGSALLGTLPGGDARVLSGTAASAPSVAASDTDAFVSPASAAASSRPIRAPAPR